MYAEHQPSAVLSPFVRCYWTLRDAAPGPGRVLPDGCIDVLFDLRDPRRARFVGTMTKPLELPGGAPVDVVGVRFAPGGAAPFLRLPARAITDAAVTVGETWPGGRALAERLAVAPRPLALLDEALRDRLAGADRGPDAAVAACVARIEATRGAVANAELERLTGWSARQLERRFAAEIGVGPKRFARVVRFRAVLELAPAVPRGAWAKVATDLGYADQSHLLREVRALGGAPLGSLR